MTNHAELIAEAETRADHLEKFVWMAKRDVNQEEMREDAAQLRRLAAALRECAVPAGWRVTEYKNIQNSNSWVRLWPEGKWVALDWTGHFLRDHGTRSPQYFPTASAAMAALDGEGK